MKQQRIWIELSEPEGHTDEYLEESAKKATKLLRKLGCEGSFEYNPIRRQFEMRRSPAHPMTYRLTDNGEWFDLDKLSE